MYGDMLAWDDTLRYSGSILNNNSKKKEGEYY